MRVTRRSPLTGLVNEREIDVTHEQLVRVCSRGRVLIQDIVPHLSPEDREFLLTGYTPEDWSKIFPPEEE